MHNEFNQRRQECAQAAKDILATPHVYIDTETSGLHNPRIVQIAIADMDGNTLLDTLVRQRWAIPAEATAIHGITTAMTKAAPRWSELLPIITELTNGQHVIFYNSEFDMRAITHTCALSGLPRPALLASCAMTLYAEYNGEWSEYWGNYKFVRLANATSEFGYYHTHAHNALEDCKATRAVMLGMANHIGA